MHKTIARTLVLLSIAAGGFGFAACTALPEEAPQVERVEYWETLRECATEDETPSESGIPSDCFWNAETRGNGIGRSFWVSGDGQAHYIDGEN